MVKNYIIQYDEAGRQAYNGIKIPTLAVIDPDDVLDNGNNRVVKLFIGAYAEEVLKILTVEDAEYAIE